MGGGANRVAQKAKAVDEGLVTTLEMVAEPKGMEVALGKRISSMESTLSSAQCRSRFWDENGTWNKLKSKSFLY